MVPETPCDQCVRPAIVDQPYCGAHRCALHFRESVDERARRELHRQFPRFRGGTVAVALSGGKDSSVALVLTHRYFRRRPNVRIVALTVDEGIAGYRAKTLESARQLTHQLGVEHLVLSHRDAYGITTDQAAKRLSDTAPCSFCGVWRRGLLNRAARDAGAEALVLGFNLDDLAQTILMNLARADLDRIGRMAPHLRRQDRMVPRIAPLATIPEREVFLYARLAELPFDHAECPHAPRAARNVFREVVWRLEDEIPGTRHALLKTQERLARLLPESVTGAPDRCAECGEPSTGPLCRGCEYLRRARGNPLMAHAGSGPP
ncbi:MAG TPA: TIGR00269 family protein [Thermoplasmata archaeon]|nr:TIGR00269 family protein [Thermoplasmata archaeon]